MKITKKHFIDELTTKETTFCGITKRLYNSDEVYCAIADLLKKDCILEKRSATAFSNHLLFNNGSSLYFNQVGNYTFHQYNYTECTVYVCCHSYVDEWDNKEFCKCMYYIAF